MEIPSGISATANAIQTAQARYNASASKVVIDTAQDGSQAEAAGTQANLPSDLVQLNQDSLVNQMLYNVFNQQRKQQETLVNLINPT